MKTFPILFKRTVGGGIQQWEIWVERVGPDYGKMVTRYGLIDGAKLTNAEMIKEGKNLKRKNSTTPYQQACLEAEARWTKQKTRKGYGLTPEESEEVRAISPMLAQTYDKRAKKVDWGTAFAQPKLDGFRLMAHRDENGKFSLVSREGKPLLALEHLAEILGEVEFRVVGDSPETFILDGEAYCHGMSLQEISSACKRKSDKSKKIEYHIYDCVFGDADFKTRSSFVSDYIESSGSSLLKPVETVKVRSESELMQCQKAFMDDGYEGAMLRYGMVGYQAGRRSDHLLKVKTFVDEEFEIVDYKFSRGKYEGCPIFVCVTKDDNHFDVLAHGSVEEKKALGKKAKACVGKKLTVKFQHYTKSECPVPFLPVAIAFRE